MNNIPNAGTGIVTNTLHAMCDPENRKIGSLTKTGPRYGYSVSSKATILGHFDFQPIF